MGDSHTELTLLASQLISPTDRDVCHFTVSKMEERGGRPDNRVHEPRGSENLATLSTPEPDPKSDPKSDPGHSNPNPRDFHVVTM